MSTNENSKESEQSTFKTWYSKNKEEFNKKRREKYKTDAAYRERVLETDRKSKASKQTTKSEEVKTEEVNVNG